MAGRWLRVGTAAVNQIPLDWQGNGERLQRVIAEAKENEVALLLTPELAVSGYGCEDAFMGSGVEGRCAEVLNQLAPCTAGIAVLVGTVVRHEGALFNCAALLADGQLRGFYAKQNLAGEGLHYEQRWFKAWPAGRVVEVPWNGKGLPLGDVCFQVGDVRIGVEICEDGWIADRPAEVSLAKRNVDVILNPSASHFAFGKHRQRRQIVCEAARRHQVSYIYANLLGNEAGRVIYDGDTFIADGERLIGVGERFSFHDHTCISADVDVAGNRQRRAQRSGFTAPTGDLDAGLVRVDCHLAEAAAAVQQVHDSLVDMPKEEEFARAVALGLFDYGRKSRSRGFVVSLSGGADSAAVACLVYHAWQLAAQQLGAKRLQELSGCKDFKEYLACVYQSTANSGQVTETAAQGLGQALGATYYKWDVQAQVDAYVGAVSGAIGRPLDWQADDVSLQNIQARARAPGVWLLANLNNALLLSTSNRSEAAVGYATMDGDTSGGLAPVAGIDKAYLRRWLQWLEGQGLAEVGPIAALREVNHQQPTAELRPPSEGQTDEADLMPYEVLDAIERLAIRDKRPPNECRQMIGQMFTQHPAEELDRWTQLFFRLWCRNQWKRERYAPSFHLDDENLDPKTWCRFPILSSGFAQELAELGQGGPAFSKRS